MISVNVQERQEKNILSRYQPFSDVAKMGLDGLIVTGGNLELSDSQEGEQKNRFGL
jgi:homoserine trans-succinylase